MLYCHIHVHAKIYIYMLDTYWRSNKRRRKTSLTIFTSQFIARVRKGCSGLRVRGSWWTNINCNILTSLLWLSHCVFLVLKGCSTGGLGPTLLDAGFLYSILSASSLDPKLHRGSRGPPRPGVAFPTTTRLKLAWNSTGSSNSTELYNRSTPTRSLKSNV